MGAQMVESATNNTFSFVGSDESVALHAAVINSRYPRYERAILNGILVLLAIGAFWAVINFESIGFLPGDRPLMFALLILLACGAGFAVVVSTLTLCMRERWFAFIERLTHRKVFSGRSLRMDYGVFSERGLTIRHGVIVPYSKFLHGVIYKDCLFLYVSRMLNEAPAFCFDLKELSDEQRELFLATVSCWICKAGKASVRHGLGLGNAIGVVCMTMLGLLNTLFFYVGIQGIVLDGTLTFETILGALVPLVFGIVILVAIYGFGVEAFPHTDMFRARFRIVRIK